MPIYTFKRGSETKDIFCKMGEIKEETKKLEKEGYKRVYSHNLAGFDSLGRSLSGSEKKNKIKSERRVRNHEHFKKEVLPTLPPEKQVDHVARLRAKGESL